MTISDGSYPVREPGEQLPPDTTFAEGFGLNFTDESTAQHQERLDLIDDNERQAALLGRRMIIGSSAGTSTPERPEVPDRANIRRTLVAKPLLADSPSKPEFVGGNLCDPTEVLTTDEYTARDLALNSLANARSRDSQAMTKVIVE